MVFPFSGALDVVDVRHFALVDRQLTETLVAEELLERRHFVSESLPDPFVPRIGIAPADLAPIVNETILLHLHEFGLRLVHEPDARRRRLVLESDLHPGR